MKQTMSKFFNFLTYQQQLDNEDVFILKENQTDTNVPPPPPPPPQYPNIYKELSKNLEYIRTTYFIPDNSDIKVKEFQIFYQDSQVSAFAVFIDGMVNNAIVNESLLMPLMVKSNLMHTNKDNGLYNFVFSTLLTQNQTSSEQSFETVISGINFGSCAIFVDGLDTCFVCDVKTWEHRPIGTPMAESVIRGPQEAFSETLRMNTALLRKNMTDQNLVLEMFRIGKRSQTPAIIAYVSDLVNPDLLNHVKDKLNAIDIDYCFDSGELEQLIEDKQFLFSPQTLSTERPDRACQSLADGRIVLMVNGSPYALILPTMVSDFLYSVEDRYIRAPFGILLRIIRLISVFISVYLSGIFISVVTYHPEFVPTQLLLSIQASSQNVSFNTIFQLIFLELLFEILHEASIRMPKHIAPIIGIVGALVIGSSLISASIVSPIIIICTATSVLATFASPNYMQNIHLRILRFFNIFLGAAGGLPFIAIGTIIVCAFLVYAKSFGVPYFAPIAPFTKKSFLSKLSRASIKSDKFRSDPINPEKKYKKR